MKYLSTLLILIGICISSVSSQSFVNEQNKWHVGNCGFGYGGVHCSVKAYKFGSPVTIDNKVYNELLRSSFLDTTIFEGTGKFYREEDSRVYIRDLSFPSEYLIYDFSKGVGDTLQLGMGYSSLDLEIINQDTVYLLSGEVRKVWTVISLNNDEGQIIEGIGSIYSPLNPIGMFSLDVWTEGRCFYVDEVKMYEFGLGDCELDMADTTTYVNEVIQKTLVDIYPNPFVSSIVVDNSALNRRIDISVYSIIGDLVYQSNYLNDKEVIQLEALQKGIYLAKVFINGRLYSTIKIIKQ